MNLFLSLTVNGLVNGAILALAALGFVLIFKATGVINFAQGEFLLVGAYAVWSAIAEFGLPWPLGIAAGLGVALILGIVVERLVLRRMIGEDPVAVIMVTIGLAAVLRALVQMKWGTALRRMPSFMPAGIVNAGPITISKQSLTAIAIAIAVLALFALFFRRSRHGIAMRAVADDQQAALTMGISVRRIFAMAWALAAVSATVGGLILANLTGVSSGLAGFGLAVFPVVILGGLDSIPGTIVGGIVIGLLAQYTGGYVDPSLQQVAPFVLLTLILLVRPYGLFGEVRIERV